MNNRGMKSECSSRGSSVWYYTTSLIRTKSMRVLKCLFTRIFSEHRAKRKNLLVPPLFDCLSCLPQGQQCLSPLLTKTLTLGGFFFVIVLFPTRTLRCQTPAMPGGAMP
jgi:hypothetical protein